MKKTLYILLSVVVWSACSQDEKRIAEFNQKAFDFSIPSTADSAKYYFEKALKLDSTSVKTIFNYVPFLINEGQYEKALKILEGASEHDKSSEIFNSLTGMCLEHLGEIDSAIALYQNQFESLKYEHPQNSEDLLDVSGFLTVQTLAGYHENALRTCNQILTEPWMTEADSMLMMPFRNEVEHYDGTGFLSFTGVDSLKLTYCIPNSDIKKLELKHHINFSGIVTYEEFSLVTIKPKFRKELDGKYPHQCE